MSETPTAPVSGADLLARIKPQLRVESTQLCLRPDLLDEFEELEEKLVRSRAADATASGTGRLADRIEARESDKTRELAAQVRELEERIEAASIWFRLRAMPKDRWRALCDRHPPRKGNELDAYTGYNRDAVLDEAVRICLFDPAFEECAEAGCDHEGCGSWQALVKKLNPSEWGELRDTVNSVNRGVVEPPKSELASQILDRPALT